MPFGAVTESYITVAHTAMTLALMALVTLVSCAAKSLMHINELDLITVKIDIYRRDSYRGVCPWGSLSRGICIHGVLSAGVVVSVLEESLSK